jgi:hypothetical protein
MELPASRNLAANLENSPEISGENSMQRVQLIATLFTAFIVGNASTAEAYYPYYHNSAPAYHPMPYYYMPMPMPMQFYFPHPAPAQFNHVTPAHQSSASGPVGNHSTTPQSANSRPGQTTTGQTNSASVADTRTVQSSPASKSKTTVTGTPTIQNPASDQSRTTSSTSRAATESVKPHSEQETVAKREQEAASRLSPMKSVMKFASCQGDPDRRKWAIERMRMIARDFHDTRAGQEASDLLAKEEK